MPDSSGSTPRGGPRAGTLILRRFGNGYQIDLDLPTAGAGVWPAIWSGTFRVDARVWAALREALEATGESLRNRGSGTRLGAETTLLPPSAPVPIERLGSLINHYLLPSEVQEELAKYNGALLLAADDPSVPWELLYDGREFLGLRLPIGRRLAATRRRTETGERMADGGALLIGDPSGDLPEAEREVDQLAELVTPLFGCRLFKGRRAGKSAVVETLANNRFSLIHFAGRLHVDPDDALRSGLVFGDGQVLTAAELQQLLGDEPFVFLNARGTRRAVDDYLGAATAGLANALGGGGTRGLVGTLWPCPDAGARQFALEFYRRSAAGLAAGEALRQARVSARGARRDDPTWPVYVLFGEPSLEVIPISRGQVTPFRAGARFGPYILAEQLGRGGMGIVWKAYQPSLDRHVALKFLAGGRGEHDQSRVRFKLEARVIARLRHPNVLLVHDFGEEQGFLYLVMEYVPGGTWQNLLERERRLGPDRVIALMSPLADALDYLHGQGVVHRDVKPSNILLHNDNVAVLADCGVARILGGEGARMTSTGAVIGTPAYMSPEQAGGQEVGPAADQYAFAVVAYEALTGRVPFEAETPVATALAHLRQVPPNPRSLNPGLSTGVERALMRALSKRPADRFPTCQAFIGALRGDGTWPGVHPITPVRDPDVSEAVPTARPFTAPRVSHPTPPLSLARRPTPSAGPMTPLTPRPLVPTRARPPLQPPPPPPPRARRYGRVPILLGLLAVLVAVLVGIGQRGAFDPLGAWWPDTIGLPASSGPRTAATPSATPVETPAPAAVPLPTDAPPTAAPQPTAAPPTETALPTPTAAPTTTPAPTLTPTLPPTATEVPPTPTPLPPILADWSALMGALDGGLWADDLPRSAQMLADYLATYGSEARPEVATARDKLYAACMELGQRDVAGGDFADAYERYACAAELQQGDPLSNGEIKKVSLWLDGDEAARRRDWRTAVARFGELAAIDADFGGATDRLNAARAALAGR